ncbi:MAG: hypothetical protein QMD22_02405 [archaeon]|nr:hypothetical protein [archaeon]
MAKSGITFGTTSGILTTLGLIVGLNAGTHSILAISWGLLLLAILTFFSTESKPKGKDIAEHLSIAIFVIIIAHYVGGWIHATFS